MEQFVFLLILGAVAFIRWLYERSQEAQARRNLESEEPESRDQRRVERPARPEISEAERMRRFMEALGIPQGEAPPPVPTSPRPQAAPIPSPTPPPVPQPVREPVHEGFEVQEMHRPESSMDRKLIEMEAAVKRADEEARQILARVPSTGAAAPSDRLKAGLQRGGALESRLQPARSMGFGADLRRRLHDPATTAEAIVLGEILGPPRAMMPHQEHRRV